MNIAFTTNANNSMITNLRDQLIAGGMNQLSLFLTGPAGAEKMTALKVARKKLL